MNTSIDQLRPTITSNLFLKLRNNPTITIVALGDSSVFGVGDIGGDIPATGAGWAGRVAHDLNSSRFLNLAKNGSRARHLTKDQLPAAIAFEPSLTLICIGTNDVLRGDFSPSEIEAALTRLIRSLKQVGSAVILLGLPDPMLSAPGPILLKKILSRRVFIVNDILRGFHDTTSVRYVDTWNSQLAGDASMWHIDRMHPSAKGHQVIADLVRRNMSLPRRTRTRLAVDSPATMKQEMFWLVTNGLKWFLKRSIDLIPALVWLVFSESTFKTKRVL